jgi:hypothetical protein
MLNEKMDQCSLRISMVRGLISDFPNGYSSIENSISLELIDVSQFSSGPGHSQLLKDKTHKIIMSELRLRIGIRVQVMRNTMK